MAATAQATMSEAARFHRVVSKVGMVPLGKMQIAPEEVTQRPFKKAWGDEIAADFSMSRFGLPCVNLRDGVFWVFDGQHRVYAAKQAGLTDADTVPCEIFEGLTDQQMADAFLGRDSRRAVSVLDAFPIAVTAGRQDARDILNVMTRLGLRAGVRTRSTGGNVVAALSKLQALHARGGPALVTRVLRTLKTAFPEDPDALEGTMIEAMGLIYIRYGNHVDEKEMTARLAAHAPGPKGLLRRAQSQRERTGNRVSFCLAGAMTEVYNKSTGPRASDRLADWWQQ